MKLLTALLLAGISSIAQAGESTCTMTFQPVDGLAAGGIFIIPVACWDWNGLSKLPTAIHLITAANVPPTNAPSPVSNWNLASLCGLSLLVKDDSAPAIVLDATKFDPAHTQGRKKEEIARATLECLRRVLPEKYKSVQLQLTASEADKAWLTPIIEAFNRADKSQPFYQQLD